MIKLLDDEAWDFDENGEYSVGALFDPDEQVVVDEMIDQAILFMELCGPLLLFMIPLSAYLVRTRL